MTPSLKQSNGTFGEEFALRGFRSMNWHMIRTQPPTKVVHVKGKPVIVQEKGHGVADFTGFNKTSCLYVACEVKEAHGKRTGASIVKKYQRDWMLANIPTFCRWVAIVWVDGQPVCEFFHFMYKGSYIKGQGAYTYGLAR